MKILVTGAGGMLGVDLVEVLAAEPCVAVTATRRNDLDIRDAGAVADAVAGHDLVINAAAWTDVDGAETAEANATEINGTAVEHVASACAAAGARLIHISTDYVLPGVTPPGQPNIAWPEDARTGPLNAYGRGKLLGENAVLATLPATGYVVRTAWLYGRHGRNFVTTMLRLAGERDTIDVVDDQIGQPTWTVALARQLAALARAAHAGRAPAGIFHGTASGQVTWAGLARAVFADSGLDPNRISPVTSERFRRPALRPANSVLGHGRWALAGISVQPDWRVQLSEALATGGLDPRA